MTRHTLHLLDYLVVLLMPCGRVGLRYFVRAASEGHEGVLQGQWQDPGLGHRNVHSGHSDQQRDVPGLPGRGILDELDPPRAGTDGANRAAGMVWFIVPLYRAVIGLSAYECFEQRFGFLACLYTSLAFVLAHFSKMGTVFFLLALALS